MSMRNPQKFVAFILVAVMLAGSGPDASGQSRFLRWLGEWVGAAKVKDAEQAKEAVKWQKKHFVSPAAREEFVAALKKARCSACHQKGEAKEVRNPFGAELSKLLQKRLKMDSEAITAAVRSSAPDDVRQKVQKALYECFDKVLEMPVDPKGDKADTYGARVKKGELPYPLPKE
jgi:hypothetical protein